MKIIKTRGYFPNDEAAVKLLYLALKNITKDWKMSAREMESPWIDFTRLRRMPPTPVGGAPLPLPPDGGIASVHAEDNGIVGKIAVLKQKKGGPEWVTLRVAVAGARLHVFGITFYVLLAVS
ncbi:MAG: hypothetical protein HYY45_09315 [Deltaproteobacteria bacterium]|nr:hypothetical protein [Deltaproteobacteria bacterium]